MTLPEDARGAERDESMPELIKINFNRPFPVFPLAGFVLLPHIPFRVHITEPRYARMVNDVLDNFGQIALATFHGDRWKQEYFANPPIRPIVCLAQIESHERLPFGGYNVALQGVCRARITEERAADEEFPYRRVMLEPHDKPMSGMRSGNAEAELTLESAPTSQNDSPVLEGWRKRVRRILQSDSLDTLRFREEVLTWFDRTEVPSHVLVDMVGHLLITSLDDSERRYRLLAIADPDDRAEYVEGELGHLARLLDRARTQPEDWPKGLSWN